jgi:bifunctional non-homologous end joining protein LigD
VGLEEYERRRDFRRTPEPRARPGRRARGARPKPAVAAGGRFVVQQHAARRMHWDFRLELDGVLKSWAVPKGPSTVPGERRMAAQTEDHPLDYADFEGVIPRGEYGGGTVVVWDRGTWEPLGDPHAGLAQGKLDFNLAGEKLRGRWHLVRLRAREGERGAARWLLIKGRDAAGQASSEDPIVATEPHSVLTGRDLEAVARDSDRVWSSRRGELREGEDGATASRPDPAALPGARRAALPRRVQPQLATLVDAPPDGAGWLHEIKLDGYRLLCALQRGAARLYSRNGLDWTDRFPALAAALRELPASSALLDGEVVVLDAQGRSSFQALQAALGRGSSAPSFQLQFFDCLHLDGVDLRAAPLVERKRLLRALLARVPQGSPLRFSDHVLGRGAEFLEAACASGVEGIVSKRLDAPYQAGRSRAWLKTKCSQRQEFVIAGFTEPRGGRVSLGALLLGAHDSKGELRYCGKVGTGFDDATLVALRARLDRLEQARSALVDPPRAARVHWVAPRLVAEVSFGEWTRDGRVRHPVFIGLREDKRSDQVRLEKPQAAPREAAGRPRRPAARADAPAQPSPRGPIAGVQLTSPDRVYFPDLGVTKRELAEYYEAMAERVLPGLAHRPLTLLRCPEGTGAECFYQKHGNDSVPEAVARVKVRGDRQPYAMVTDLRSLVSLVQIGALELHVWGARADRLDRPDLVVFDLDPDPAVAWRRVLETAGALRAFLAELGLVAFARLTGGKGVHVVAPLQRRSTWDQVRRFSQSVAGELVRLAPRQFTARMSKARRTGKIFIDWFRNTPEATAIASYSARARPGAPVALPVSWEELETLHRPLHESVREVPRRLAGPDPWADFEASRRPLSRAALRRVGVED